MKNTITVLMQDELDLRSAAGRSGLTVAEVVHVMVVMLKGGLRAFRIKPGPACPAVDVHGSKEVEVDEADAAFIRSLSGATGVPVQDIVTLAMSRGARGSLLGLVRLQPELWSSTAPGLRRVREEAGKAAAKVEAGKGKA